MLKYVGNSLAVLGRCAEHEVAAPFGVLVLYMEYFHACFIMDIKTCLSPVLRHGDFLLQFKHRPP